MDPFDASFAAPPKSARPMVRWWWTGADVQREELVREVQELDQAGFAGAEIQVFMTGSPQDLAKRDRSRWERSHRYMQPYYYEMVGAVLDEAAPRGLTMDLTICSAWPAGGVHVSKDQSMKVLLMGAKTLTGGRRYVGRVPRFKRPFLYKVGRWVPFLGSLQTFYPADMQLIRVVAAKPLGKPGKVRSFRARTARLEPGTEVDLTPLVDADSTLTWDVPEGTWQVFAFYAGPSGVHPLMDAKEDPEKTSLVLDHLDAEPIQQHLDYHLGRGESAWGEHVGRTLRAFFTDSLELSPEWIWTDRFMEEFARRRGYDLAPFLPVNYVPGRDNKYLAVVMHHRVPCFDYPGDLGQRVRYDFERTVSDLFTEAFGQTMADWAEAHGLQSRIQAYGIRADTLKAYGVAHIPETEQLYAGGMLDFLKLAGSAGVIYDKPLVTAESLVWNRRDYLTTPLKWKVAADRLFVAGVNQMIYHGFPYQHPAFPYPGYDAFSSPYLPRMACFASNMGRANPFWEFFPRMNGYVARCQHALQQGKTVANVGLFYPLFNYPDSVLKREELVGGYLDAYDAPLDRRAIGGGVKKKLDADERWTLALIKLGDDLTANGYAYVHLNEESVLRARVEGGQQNGARLVVGAARLDALVLAGVERITLELARKLEEIQTAGVPVVFGGSLPHLQPGYLDYQTNEPLIAETTRRMARQHGNWLASVEGVTEHLKERLAIAPDLAFDAPQPTIQAIHKRAADQDIYFLRHAGNTPVRVSVRFAELGRVPHLLDPWTGDVAPAAQYEAVAQGVRMDLQFDAYGSKLIAFREAATPRHVVHAERPVVREGGELVAYAAAAGEYAFRMDDGRERRVTVARAAPRAVDLTAWRLDTELRAPDGSTAPIHLELERLVDWRELEELRYCSSKGAYTCRIPLSPQHVQAGLRLVLELGRVHDAAVVRVNGRELAPLLAYPYSVDITPYLRPVDNTLEVVVTPTLRNRLIGYARQGGRRERRWRQFRGRKDLAPSGLIGPVRLVPRWRLELADEDAAGPEASPNQPDAR